MYPLLMSPYFRHGSETPWGGNVLGEWFGKDVPGEKTGESLEVSALPGRESVVANGPCAGKTFTAMIEAWGKDLTGTDNTKEFPLLLKLLDADDMLSVQVHPGDEYAIPNEGKYGKSEAWVVLSAAPGAKIAYGLDTNGKDLSEIVAEGKLESALHWETVAPGEVYYIPHGMVHALGGGIQCYEIQQSSDVTYRFWDWNRVGKDGQPRELHTQKALDVSRPELDLHKIPGTSILCEGGIRTYYISDENFELCRLNVSGRMPLPEGRMLFVTPTDSAVIRWGEESLEVKPFQTVVVPAALPGVSIEGKLTVLMSSLPDQDYLREELNYRAADVAGLTAKV